MKRFNTINYLISVLALSLFMSCVGTVEDSKVDINSLNKEDKGVILFSGLEKAKGISHDKIELEFTPLGDGNANIKYFLYINGGQSPIEVNPESLDDAVSGRKRYLVSGLNINTSYKFRLRIKNILTNSESAKEKELVAKTFDNKTSDFKGITSVSKVTGMSDSTIFVEWVPAKMDGVIVTKEYDPLFYQVSIIGPGGPENLNNPNYVGLDKDVKEVPKPLIEQISPMNHNKHTSTLVDSLKPDTTYYVQVRAINKLWYNFYKDPMINIIPVDRELNTKFLKIKTDPANGVFDFNRDSLRVANTLGANAFTKVNAFWSPGTGTFSGYRIFLRKYPLPNATESTVLGDDRMSLEQMQGVIDGTIAPSDGNGRFVDADTTKTSLEIGSLSSYEWYQFKIIQCKNTMCPVYPLTDPNLGIVSEMRAIRVQPYLAPFDGITRIDNPKLASGLDEIIVNFDPAVLTVGYADKLEVYCIDPTTVGTNPAAYVYDPSPLSTIARTGSPVSKCNGLYLKDEPLLPDKSLIIKGVKAIPAFSAADATYCYTVFPAIRYQAEQIPPAGTYPVNDWVVRCVTPEVKTPTASQFGGFTGSCNAVQDTIGLTWTAPTGGIYANYRIFYRTIAGNQSFKFSEAIAGNPAYSSVSVADGTLAKTLTGLRPGNRYRMGILAEIEFGGKTLYSEYNTSIKDCVTPMPIATFDEWTRVFAIGPKVDGRFPHTLAAGNKRAVHENAKILEALNVDGIPYEVGTDSAGNIDPLSFVNPPGHYHAGYLPTNFNQDFDGAFGTYRATSVTASNNGIVSLGWKDVSLDFLDLEFKECQRHPTDPAITTNTACSTVPTLKKDRTYGYKVFRSIDNRLSWKDITGTDGVTGISLVYSRDYNYRKRPNSPSTTERMAFFTDYSVQAIYTDPEGRERGRVLWYKIVPYFEQKPMLVDGGGVTGPNIIKVVLPPPNMALVKREMANRNTCMEIGRDSSIDKTNAGHYSCAWNGLGARPKGTPWNKANQIIDLGGDLLVDRYELGCQFTRGDYASIPEEGMSYFKRVGSYPGARSDLADFTGYRTDVDGNDTGDPLLGCTKGGDTIGGANLESYSGRTDTSIDPDYKKVLFGDCIGTGVVVLPTSYCDEPLRASSSGYKFPGAAGPGLTPFDCSIPTSSRPDDPQNFVDRLNYDFRRNLIVQSEFGAIFYHRDISTYNHLPPTGPGHANLITAGGGSNSQKQCFINLAAVGSDGKVRARWFPAEDLNIAKQGAGVQNITKKGMSQIYSDPNFFDNDEYKLPTIRSVARFDGTTPVGKVATANSAKLPPITGISQNLAREYCETYDIEVGISTDGMNFLPSMLPTTKRMLRRVEYLAASHWPTAAVNDAQSLDYTDITISTIEGADAPGTCISATKAMSSGGMGRNSSLVPQMPTVNVGGAGFSGRAFTGSSARDHTDPDSFDHSGKCISEFGIQDLIGNVSELSTERMFCDYTKDKLWFGKYDGGDPFAQTGIGDEANSIQMSNFPNALFWKDMTVHYEKPDGSYRQVGTRVTGGGNIVAPNVAWPQIDPDSGYCSIVDNVEAYATQLSRFRDAVDNFYPVSIPGGGLNTAMIANENLIDRQSVNFLRNGDGAFLSFGALNLAPQLKDANSLAINNFGASLPPTEGLGPYFNPVIGMPLACGGSSCLETPDNKRVTTAYLAPKVGSGLPLINNFPTGNSQIYNIGISDVVHTGNASYYTVDLTLQPLDYSSRVIYEIYVKLDGTLIVNEMVLADWWSWYNTTFGTSSPGVQEFSGIRFALARGTQLINSNGGSFKNARTGRYTISMIDGSEESTKSTVGPGFRCGVMLSSD